MTILRLVILLILLLATPAHAQMSVLFGQSFTGAVDSVSSLNAEHVTVTPTTGAVTVDLPADVKLGVNTTTAGTLTLYGGTSGNIKLVVPAVAGTRTLTLPAATDTVLGKATVDVLTNKTYDTAGTGNVFSINGTAVSAVTGTGAAVLANTPTLITPVLGVATGTSFQGIVGNVTPAAGTFTTGVFTTSATSPLVLGGTAANSALTLQSTSGVGTTDAIALKVGNAGAVTALAITTTGAATFGATLTVTTRTGTPAAFACFDSGGKLVESATACQ